jgi:hypothetical protein
VTLPADELWSLLLWTLLNPAAVAVAFFIGRRADQVQKIIVAAFAAGAAGVLVGWLLPLLGLPGPGRKSLAGLFAFCFAYGLLWGWIGFRTRR